MKQAPATSKTLLELLDNDNLVLRLDLSEQEFEWCTDFLAILVWFASMFQEDFVFRGHANANWNLQPRLARITTEPAPSTFSELVVSELRFVNEIRRSKWMSLREGFSPSEYVDFIGILQHKGVPTRLIDVTADPLVATYFAALNDSVDGSVVSILRQSASLSEKVEDTDPIHFSGPASYMIWSPPPVDPRSIAQRGEFLLVNGDEVLDLTGPMILAKMKPRGKANYKLSRISDEYFQHSTRGRPVEHAPNLTMFYLPAKYKMQMRTILESLGVSSRSLFPDLQGYAAMFNA